MSNLRWEMNKNQVSLGKKLYAIVMCLMMVASLWPSGATSALAEALSVAPGKYGKFTYEQNSTKNGFEDEKYDDYRDEQATEWLGIAGSFHITGFTQVETHSHIYGNILTAELVGSNNFGPTSWYAKEYGYTPLTYIQSYPNPSGNPAGDSDSVLVIGSENSVTTTDNGNALAVNGTKIDQPNTLIQDTDTANNPFIDLVAVKEKTIEVSDELARVADVGATVSNQGSNWYIDYEGDEGCAYVSLKASELNNMDQLFIRGMALNGKCSVLVNVDMDTDQLNLSKVHVLDESGNQMGTGETDSKVGYVMFNIKNSTKNMTISLSDRVLASVLAPNSKINLNGSAAGTYIGDTVYVGAESHIRPFHGTLKPVQTGVSVNKQWLDAYGDEESDDVVSTHEPVSVQLYRSANGGDFEKYGESVLLSNENDWKYTWDGLTKKDTKGNTYEYEVREVSETAGYVTGDPVKNNDDGTSWTVTNRHVAVGKVSINKVWDDGDDADQIRPSEVKVTLYRCVDGGEKKIVEDGIVLNAKNNWSYSKDYLPLTDAEGNEYTYGFSEAQVEGYEEPVVTVGEPAADDHGNTAWAFTLTNKHKPVAEKTSVSVDKTWLTAAGKPEGGDHPAVKVQLYQSKNGGESVALGDEVELSADNGWTYTWNDLVKVDGYSNQYTYSVKETGVPAGYSSAQGNDGNTWHVTNTRKATASVSVEKKWSGASDSEIPDEVTFTLSRSVSGGAAEVVRDITVKKADGWKASVSDLEAVNAAGEAYSYTLAEKTVEGFSSVIENLEPVTDATTGNVSWSFTATNTKTQRDAYTNVGVVKKWENAAGETSAPGAEKVTVQLYRSANGGEAVAYGDPVELSASNDWKASWSNLLKYESATQTNYTYEVRETAVDGYVATSQVSYNEATDTYEVAITNKAKATVQVKVNKAWDDANDADGLRPAAVKVDVIQTTADGKASKVVETLELTAENNWSSAVAGLAKADAEGNDYVYSVKESAVAGYEAKYFDPAQTTDSDGNSVWTFSLKNTHEQAKTSVTVTKAWDDADDQDGIRPESVTVDVVRTLEGSSEKETVKTVELCAANDWTAAVADLPANKDGKAYTYSVEEAKVDGYTAKVEQVDGEEGAWVFSLTNTHEAEKTSVFVKKVWADEDDFDQIRPSEVKVQLCAKAADGTVTPVAGYDPVVLNEGNDWGADGTLGWGELPVNVAGAKVNYTVVELDVADGYTAQVSDGLSTDDGKTYTFTVTNTHTADKMEFSLTGYSVASITETLDADEVCYVDPKIYKKLVGRKLKAGEFTFKLYDEKTGEVVSQTSNDETGMVDFDAANNVSGDDMNPCCLKFTAEGTYTYVVQEVSETKDATVNYSDEVVKFVVVVSRDASGKLVTDGGHYYYFKSATDTMGVESAASDHPTITNTVKGVMLGLTKVDESGVALAGATYGLFTYAADGTEVLVAQATSDAEGAMTFGLVSDNVIAEDTEYWYREIAAPAGYQLSYEETAHFKVSHDKGGYYLVDLDGNKLGDTVAPGVAIPFTHNVVDTALCATVLKVDSNRDAVKGAKLAVYESGKTQAIDEWVSDGAGHKIGGLLANKTYVLREVETPDGFRRAADVEFKLSADGTLTLVSGGKNTVNGVNVVNAYTAGGSLSLVDYRIDEREEVREDKRAVYKKDGKEISREEYEEIVIKRKGSKSEAVPYTGDNTKQGIGLLAAAGVLACAGCVFWMRSRREN